MLLHLRALGRHRPGGPQGLFFHDTRLVSRWQLTIGGQSVQVLAVASREPYSATFVSRLPPPGAQTELLLERRRWIGNGMREDLRLRNLSPVPVRTTVSLAVSNDFADVFAVKENRVMPTPVRQTADGDTLFLGGPTAGRFEGCGCPSRAPPPATAGSMSRSWCPRAATGGPASWSHRS